MKRYIIVICLAFVSLLAITGCRVQRAHATQADITTCFITGGGQLKVCHTSRAEGVYYQPSSSQVAYNTQILDVGGGKYATVLHSEAEDTQAIGHIRPGDSIKAGIVDTANNPNAAYTAPPDLNYRIWGSLTNPASPLYYAIDPQNPAARGISGGGNPMVIRGLPGDSHFYVFYLGVMSDAGQGAAWRNVLLEARTQDFEHFELLQESADGQSVWVAFAGDQAMPALVADVLGHDMVSNQPAFAKPPGPHSRRKHVGIKTAGLFGSIVFRNGLYYYFYTDEDETDPTRNHLYVRTATDLSANRRWSAPQIVMDVPPEIMFRVAKARGMDRWAVEYMCLRSVEPFISDLCLQYTSNMNISGPGGISSLTFFDGPVYNGHSPYALGLMGENTSLTDGDFLKIQPFYLTDSYGTLAVPPDQAGNPATGGMATWNDLANNYNIFGAPTYWGEWSVTPVDRPASFVQP